MVMFDPAQQRYLEEQRARAAADLAAEEAAARQRAAAEEAAARQRAAAAATQTTQTTQTTRTPAVREQELRDALAAAQAVQSGQVPLAPGITMSDYNASIQDIAAKVNVIDTYKTAGQDMPAETKAIIYGPLAPYTDLNKGTVDVVKAVKDGVPDAELRTIGVSQIDIVKTRQDIAQGVKEKKIQVEVNKIEAERLKEKYVDVGNGLLVAKDDWNQLDQKYRDIAQKQGIAAMDEAIKTDYKKEVIAQLEQSFDRFKDKNGKVDLVAAIKSGLSEKTVAMVYGDEAAEKAAQRAKYDSGFSGRVFSGIDIAAKMVVPVYATVKDWDNMSSGQKALSIVMDAISLAPMVGAAAKGARGSFAITRAGRLIDAGKGIANEAISQLRAPVDMVLHPIATVKGVGGAARETIENIAHFKKIPSAVITTSENTVRLPVTATTTEKEAGMIRDTIMETTARTGEDIVMEFNGQRFTVPRSAFMKEMGGGLAHATPMGESFEAGLKVMPKPDMPPREQGLFLSHEPLPRFATSSAHGAAGTKPTILVVAPDIAQDAISSEKIYPGPLGKVAEFERKFPVNYEVPKPAQRLFTRIGPERTRVEILLVGKKLNPIQIAKLKSLAVIEDLKAPFKPSLLVDGRPPEIPISKVAKDIDVEPGVIDNTVKLTHTKTEVINGKKVARNYSYSISEDEYKAIVGNAKLKDRGDILREWFNKMERQGVKATITTARRNASAIQRGLTDDEVRTIGRTLADAGHPGIAANVSRISRGITSIATTRRVGKVSGIKVAEIRLKIPGTNRTRRVQMVASGEPIQRVPRRIAERNRGRDIELTRRDERRDGERRDDTRRDDARREEPRREDTRQEVRRGDVRRDERTTNVRRDVRREDVRRDVRRDDVRRNERIEKTDRTPRTTKKAAIRLKKDMSDEQKRAIIADPDNTAFTWTQGKLHGEPVHHVGIVNTDGDVAQTSVVGPAPQGAIKATGRGQSFKSITLTTKGKLDQPVRLEGGAVDPIVSPTTDRRGVTIRFVQDDTVKARVTKPRFTIRRTTRRSGSGIDLGADIVRDRRGRHLRL